MENPEIYQQDPVRFEVMRHLGYFVTESTNHMSEYIPWVRKRPELIKEMALRSVKDSHLQSWEARRADYRDQMRRQAAGDEPIEGGRTNEYCSYVIHSEVTNTPFRVNGNVRNTGLITNLPEGCCVEVPCLVDRTGINPCHVGELPPQLAALTRPNIHAQDLAPRPRLEQNRDHGPHAVQLHP